MGEQGRKGEKKERKKEGRRRGRENGRKEERKQRFLELIPAPPPKFYLLPPTLPVRCRGGQCGCCVLGSLATARGNVFLTRLLLGQVWVSRVTRDFVGSPALTT